MAGLSDTARNRRRRVNVGKLQAILATERPITGTKDSKIALVVG